MLTRRTVKQGFNSSKFAVSNYTSKFAVVLTGDNLLTIPVDALLDPDGNVLYDPDGNILFSGS